MVKTESFAQIEVSSADELWAWLSVNHARTDSVWLVTHKKSAPDMYVSTAEVLDALIAHGWIDGMRRKLDEHRTMQLIGPRKQQAWASSYKCRAEQLEADGRMTEAGRKAIAASKDLGLWDFFDDVDNLVEPLDLVAALEENSAARAHFGQSAQSYRRNVLRWIKIAKTEKTRSKRIAEVVATHAGGGRVAHL